MITANLLREIMDYDPDTGEFRWCDTFVAGLHCLRRHPRPKPGDLVKASYSNGYLSMRLDGRLYYMHRLAWMHTYGWWPSKHLDHRDRDTSNNRLSNLREATQSQNFANGQMGPPNTSGFRGVDWHPQSKKWRASVVKDGKRISCGLYKTKEEAAAARDATAVRKHVEFATLNFRT
jgi:HNH endonuclease/AP2 domain